MHAPMIPGRDETDQIQKICKLLGTPTEKIWPGEYAFCCFCETK